MQKITDSNPEIMQGGRVWKYWIDKGIPDEKKVGYKGSSAISHNGFRVMDFCKAWKFNGVEFGNYMSQLERYDRILGLSDEFAKVFINIVHTTNIGMSYQLNIAFGARGMGGGTLAHYEPGTKIINITKQHTKTFAHEYGHAIDFIFGTYIDQSKDSAALTYGDSEKKEIKPTGGQFRIIANNIVNLANNCDRAGNWLIKGGYWARRTEIFARMFEQYVAYKAKGYNHEMLSGIFIDYTNMKYYCSKDYFIKKLVPQFDKFMRLFGKECNKK